MALRTNYFTGSRTKNPWANVKFGEAQEPEPPMVRRAIPDEYDYSNPSLDEFAAHVNRMPTEDQYGPSIMRRILAGVGGAVEGYRGGPIRGMAAAEHINSEPYRTAYDEWSRKGAGLETVARLENSNITQRRLYQGMNMRDENADETNRIRALSAATQQFNANTARQRNEFTQAIANAKDETARMRLTAQKNQWEKLNTIAEKRLNIERDRTGAYRRSVDLQADRLNREPNDTQLAARRRMAAQRVYNENSDWYDKNGNVRPEMAQSVEEQIQRYMQTRRSNNINLPSFGTADDSDWVVSPR